VAIATIAWRIISKGILRVQSIIKGAYDGDQNNTR